jgi:hypothetical protein
MRKLLSFFFALAAVGLFATPALAVFNKVESFPFTNISSTPASFVLRGGNYGLTCHATWGGGSATLQRLSPDGSTYVTVITAITTDGYASANLPSGTYRLSIAAATGVYCDVVSTITTQ